MDDFKRYNFQSTMEENESFLKLFGNNLRKQRFRKGLTQEQLGDMAKVNYKYIGEVERGEKNPTAIVICKLSRALDVSVSEILLDSFCNKFY